ISGIGVDSVTGSVVNLPLNSQIQVAGAKGSGKSWAFRPLMASLVTSPHHEMVFMDPKVVEGGTWKGVVPTYFPGEFADALEEGVEDMYARRDLMQREGATVWRPEFGPYRIYMVDEGREFLRSEEHTSELQSRENLVCRLLLEKKNQKRQVHYQ